MTGKYSGVYWKSLMNELNDFLSRFYTPQDYPALYAQLGKWQKSRPLDGIKILDATPVFRNTMVKYSVLLAAGADITVSTGKDIPYDPEILKILPRFGIRTADDKIRRETFDVVADCAGRHRNVSSRFGYAELTRSGLEYYRDCPQPVFSVDSGILKRFETTLGTGESFVRAMKHLGFYSFSGKKVLIFGGGKVGRGTAYYSALAGAKTLIVDKNTITPPAGVDFISTSESKRLSAELADAWCVVSATGLPGVLAEYVPALLQNKPVIANMGVEDEFGETLPESAVLNNKRPLNFILEEPTWISYIDPSMALSNAALLSLLQKNLVPGINLPPSAMEMQIIDDIRNTGKMNNEIDLILKEFNL